MHIYIYTYIYIYIYIHIDVCIYYTYPHEYLIDIPDKTLWSKDQGQFAFSGMNLQDTVLPRIPGLLHDWIFSEHRLASWHYHSWVHSYWDTSGNKETTKSLNIFELWTSLNYVSWILTLPELIALRNLPWIHLASLELRVFILKTQRREKPSQNVSKKAYHFTNWGKLSWLIPIGTRKEVWHGLKPWRFAKDTWRYPRRLLKIAQFWKTESRK